MVGRGAFLIKMTRASDPVHNLLVSWKRPSLLGIYEYDYSMDTLIEELSLPWQRKYRQADSLLAEPTPVFGTLAFQVVHFLGTGYTAETREH